MGAIAFRDRAVDGGLNMNDTLPLVPRLPPFFEMMLRTVATVRVGLSVAVSTNSGMPCGA